LAEQLSLVRPGALGVVCALATVKHVANDAAAPPIKIFRFIWIRDLSAV